MAVAMPSFLATSISSTATTITICRGRCCCPSLSPLCFALYHTHTGEQAAAARAAHRAVLSSLRPDAVALVDAFGWEDYALNSALGRYDGDVYNALLRMAAASPLNSTQEGPAWEGVLRPVMQRKPVPKL